MFTAVLSNFDMTPAAMRSARPSLTWLGGATALRPFCVPADGCALSAIALFIGVRLRQ
jgi:hypothetical protein